MGLVGGSAVSAFVGLATGAFWAQRNAKERLRQERHKLKAEKEHEVKVASGLRSEKQKLEKENLSLTEEKKKFVQSQLEQDREFNKTMDKQEEQFRSLENLLRIVEERNTHLDMHNIDLIERTTKAIAQLESMQYELQQKLNEKEQAGQSSKEKLLQKINEYESLLNINGKQLDTNQNLLIEYLSELDDSKKEIESLEKINLKLRDSAMDSEQKIKHLLYENENYQHIFKEQKQALDLLKRNFESNMHENSEKEQKYLQRIQELENELDNKSEKSFDPEKDLALQLNVTERELNDALDKIEKLEEANTRLRSDMDHYRIYSEQLASSKQPPNHDAIYSDNFITTPHKRRAQSSPSGGLAALE